MTFSPAVYRTAMTIPLMPCQKRTISLKYLIYGKNTGSRPKLRP